MNILIFNWRDLKHSWAGGGEIYIFEQAKRWVKLGNKVTVFCGQDVEKKLPEKEVYDGITVIRKGGRFSVYFWAIWFYLFKKQEKYDFIVDVENGIPFFTPFFAFFVPKVCIVYHVHGKQFFYELPFGISHIGYFIERYVFSFLYRSIPIIAISQTTKNELVKIGFKKKNIHIVYCGINGKDKHYALQKKFSTPTILYLGRIKAYKRVDLLVTLFGEILKKVPHARLLIAGWGTDASSVTDLVMKSKFRKRIELIGPVSEAEKRKLLSKSWVFVNPSIGEGWSIAVIEANLYGTPAVAFNVPGLHESVKNNETGFLVKSHEELILKIIRVLSSKTTRNRLSQKAYEWAHLFSWEKAAGESYRLFDKIK